MAANGRQDIAKADAIDHVLPSKLSPSALGLGSRVQALYTQSSLSSSSSVDSMDYTINRTIVNPNHSRSKSYNADNRTKKHSSTADEYQVDTKRRKLFDEKVRLSNIARQAKDYELAITLYTDAINLDPSNHFLYSNRSGAFVELRKYEDALQDARMAKQLNAKFAKAYYREGIALQCLQKSAESLAAFAAGLAQDPKSPLLLSGLVEATKQSPLKDRFIPLYNQLERLQLAQSPFVLLSVIGQELLVDSCYDASVAVLESALRIGTCSLKLRGSVFSALASAHWGSRALDKAVACMQQDLAIVKTLGDPEGECRSHGNLGAAYHSKGNYREALTHQRCQLLLAMRLKQHETAAAALSSLGHVYTAIGDYPNALSSHKQCVIALDQVGDPLKKAREIGNVGAVFLAMGEFECALECHNEHLKIARECGNKAEEARAFSNLGSAHHYRRSFHEAVDYHNKVLTIAKETHDKNLEARAYAGLGHAARCTEDFYTAKECHEKQLENALCCKDRVAEGRACSNLGIIYQNLGQYDAAVKLQKAHLKIAKDLGDRASQGRAYGNQGNAYSCMGQYEMAIKFHKQELSISHEVNDRHAECSTHGNLAVAYQSLSMSEKALQHYTLHLKLSRELRDSSGETRALSNLGNFHCSQKEFTLAVPFYQQFLILVQELGDTHGESQACHKLGYAHYCLGQYKEAIRYYDQDLTLARDLQDSTSLCRAYCNLGIAYKAQGDLSKALDFQKWFLATAHSNKNFHAKFVAIGNMGDIFVKQGELKEAIVHFNQQLKLAKVLKKRSLEATAHGNLGSTHRMMSKLDTAEAHHNQELSICQELDDVKSECKAHGHLGNVHLSAGNFKEAYKSYEEQLEKAHDLNDCSIEAQAYGNLGICKMNMGELESAIGQFEQQLALLEQLQSSLAARLDRGRALGNLGDCHEALGELEDAVNCQEKYLSLAQSCGPSIVDQDRAYRGLGNAHRASGNLQQALVCFEKRLVVAHELDKPAAKASAYGELGCLHSLLGNFEQAISCLQHQLSLAQEMGDRVGEGDAACGLGGVYQQMGEYEKALEYHQTDLEIAEEMENTNYQCRACGNIGLSHESLQNFKEAISYQEQHLSIAAQNNDKTAKTLAYSSLGRVHHATGNYQQAVQYLQQGLAIAEKQCRREDEAKIRHQLGLALWGHADLDSSQSQLYKAVELFESIRREAQISSDYRMSLFDLQTASYQALQRVLVALNRTDEALVVAERGRTRAFIDLLLERQHAGDSSWYSSIDSAPVTLEHMLEIISKQSAAVLYYSLAAGYLYSWLITPDKGVVKFHECSVNDLEQSVRDEIDDTLSVKSLNASTTSMLDHFVGNVRESLGVEAQLPSIRSSLNRSTSYNSESESESDDLFQSRLSELGGKLNADNDTTGFLRLVNRNHLFNCSSYSLSSLLSLGSVTSSSLGGGLNTPGSLHTPSVVSSSSSVPQLNSSNGGARSVRSSIMSRKSASSNCSTNNGRPPLGALYDLLIAPMEDCLKPDDNRQTWSDLVLVLQGDLYLVPFAVLRGTQKSQCLYERFSLIAVPSLRALQASHAIGKHNKYNPDCSGAVIIGNPMLPQTVIDQWQWGPLLGAEHECRVVGEMLGARPLMGSQATRGTVEDQVQRAEVVHLATHVSWKLVAVVLAPVDFGGTTMHGNFERMDFNETSSGSELNHSLDGPPLNDYLLTAADILNMKLTAKLVVLSSGHTDDRAGRINSDGVVGLTRAILAAGAQCVLFSLWPVPEAASKMLMKAFYTSLLQGIKTSQALSDAMRSVQNSRQFSHPLNWASWVLVGSDVRLSSKVALMGHALCQLLRNPAKSREAMRVVLHLVEKSLQRIHKRQCQPMYTTHSSIKNKVGDITGWTDLLKSVGFRFESSQNQLPSSVFFPTSDPADRLTQCSASLQALLGLSVPTLTALSKMLDHQEVGEAVTALIREVNRRFTLGGNLQMQISVRLWRAPGCHEFLASIGFDLVDVGKDEVTVRAGKQANRRIMQFAQQALVAVFDTQEAPRALLLDSSSSLESLASTGSATSTSNFSPPGSPGSHRKSFFNPAEVDKLPSAKKTLGGRRSLSSRHPSDISLQLSYQNHIRQKYSSVEETSDTSGPIEDTSTDGPNRSAGYGDNVWASYGGENDSSSQTAGGTGVSYSLTDSYIPTQPPMNVYSTSASDSEENTHPNTRLSRTHSRSSVISGASSTHTLKSNSGVNTRNSVDSISNGPAVLRRNRVRSSVSSVKSLGNPHVKHLSEPGTLIKDHRASERFVDRQSKENRDKERPLLIETVHGNNGSGLKLLSPTAKKHLVPTMTRPPILPERKGTFLAPVQPPLDAKAEQLSMDHSFSDTLSNDSTLPPSMGPSMAPNLNSAFRRMSSNRSIVSNLGSMTPRRLEVSVYNTAADGASQCSNENEGTINPTEVAHKVLAETWLQRHALEKMQRQSAFQLKQRQYDREIKALENLERNHDDTSSLEAVSPLAVTDYEDLQDSSTNPAENPSKSGKPAIPQKPANLANKNIDDLPPSYAPPKIPDYNQIVSQTSNQNADSEVPKSNASTVKVRDDLVENVISGNALHSLSINDRSEMNTASNNWYDCEDSEGNTPRKSLSHPTRYTTDGWGDRSSVNHPQMTPQNPVHTRYNYDASHLVEHIHGASSAQRPLPIGKNASPDVSPVATPEPDRDPGVMGGVYTSINRTPHSRVETESEKRQNCVQNTFEDDHRIETVSGPGGTQQANGGTARSNYARERVYMPNNDAQYQSLPRHQDSYQNYGERNYQLKTAVTSKLPTHQSEQYATPGGQNGQSYHTPPGGQNGHSYHNPPGGQISQSYVPRNNMQPYPVPVSQDQHWPGYNQYPGNPGNSYHGDNTPLPHNYVQGDKNVGHAANSTGQNQPYGNDYPQGVANSIIPQFEGLHSTQC